MKLAALVALFALVALPLSAARAGDDLSQLSHMKNPGLWEITSTTKMEISGTKMAMPAQTHTSKKCVTQKDLDDMANFTPKPSKEMTCKLTDKDVSGNVFTFAMTCSGTAGTMDMTGKTTFASKNASQTHVEMNGKMQNMPMHITLDADSKRIGACKDSDKD